MSDFIPTHEFWLHDGSVRQACFPVNGECVADDVALRLRERRNRDHEESPWQPIGRLPKARLVDRSKTQ